MNGVEMLVNQLLKSLGIKDPSQVTTAIEQARVGLPLLITQAQSALEEIRSSLAEIRTRQTAVETMLAELYADYRVYKAQLSAQISVGPIGTTGGTYVTDGTDTGAKSWRRGRNRLVGRNGRCRVYRGGGTLWTPAREVTRVPKLDTTIIEPTSATPGGPGGSANATTSNGSSDGGSGIEGRNSDPEILTFLPIGEPVTIPVSEVNSGASGTGTGADPGEPRRTKSGRFDRRTRAGRTAGSNEAETSPIPVDRISLTELLLSLHEMGAAILKTPELDLDRDEAQKLSKAVQEVSKYYAMSFDPKKVALGNLAIVMGGIYVPRIMAYRLRKATSEPGAPTPAEQPREKLVNIKPTKKAESAPTNGRPQLPSDLWPEPAADGFPIGS
jgi:hypothetical protein